MIHERFNEVFEEVVAEARQLCASKNAEYARGGDKLHNFKKAAGLAMSSQESALAGMMLKHTVSIFDMVDDIERGKYHSLEKWEEKVLDHIIYLILLYAMQVEAQDSISPFDEILKGIDARTDQVIKDYLKMV